MRKCTGVLVTVVLFSMLVLSAGCALFRRQEAAHSLIEEKGYDEVITEEELAALGIEPAASARGMSFAETGELQTVYFPFDSSDILPETRRALDANADFMRQNPRVSVMVEGHCDERGTVEYNLALGQRRADSVRRYLAASGINPERIYSISYGKEKPADPRSNEEAWAKNRRAEFRVRVR